MPVPPITRDAITAALKECGPMSVVEICERLNMERSRVNSCLTTARTNHPGKFFRIVRYQPQSGSKGREAPIYAAAPGRDADRPVFDREYVANQRRDYYLRNRARFAVSRKRRRGVVDATPWSGLVPMARRAA